MSFRFSPFGPKRDDVVLVLYCSEYSVDYAVLDLRMQNIKMLMGGVNVQKNVTLEQAIAHVLAQVRPHAPVTSVILSFSSLTLKAHILQEKYVRSHEGRVISDKELHIIEREIEGRSELAMRKKLLQNSGILPNDFERISMSVLARRIDGYRVDSLSGLKGKEVVFDMSGTFVLAKILAAVRTSLEGLGVRQIRLTHIMQGIREFASGQKRNGVYVHVGNDNTQIGIWKDGTFDFEEGIPVGGHQFREVFGSLLGMSEDIAEEFQDQYFAGHVSKELREKLHSLILPQVQNFGTVIAKRLSGVKAAMPADFWIFGGGSKIQDVLNMFDKESEELLPVIRAPELEFLLPKDIGNVQNFPHDEDPRYTPLFLLAIGSLPSRAVSPPLSREEFHGRPLRYV